MIHDTIKQRLRASLLLAPSAKSALASALPHAATIRSDGGWDDLPLLASQAPGMARPPHLERTLLLAKAHRAAAGALDDPLRRALDFWLSHDPISADWRQDQIVVPRLVGEIALLCDSSLSSGAADKVLEILARSRWANWVALAGWVDRMGMEMLGVAYNHLLRGCLENAPAFFDAAFARIFREFRPAKSGEPGIRADMTFDAPGNEPATAGVVFLREGAQFIALAHGTPWQAPADAVKLFVGFVLDGQQWMLRQGAVDAGTSGEGMAEPVDAEGLAVVIQQLAQAGNPPRRSELSALVRRLQGRGEALSGHRHFWQARISVHQRPAFHASLRLTPPPSADGWTSFRRPGGDEHGPDPSAEDTTPGTTTLSGGRGSESGPVTPHEESALDWLSGGVSEGDCGLAATEFQHDSLSGKKSWFFFDESVVCLGTDLHAASANLPVYTTVNSSRLRGPMLARSVDGKRRELPPGQTHHLSSVHALEHDGICYLFPHGGTLLVDGGESVDATESPIPFRVRIDHGTQPRGASWTCVVLPTGDDPDPSGRVAEEVACLDLLANTPALQAVRHRGLGLLAAAFWSPGTVSLPDGGRVAANQACVLLCRDLPGGGTRLSLSALTNQPATIHVEYGGQCVAFELAGGTDARRSTSRLI